MQIPNERELKRIAAHLITYSNTKAKRRLKKNNIDSITLFDIPRSEMPGLGLEAAEIDAICSGDVSIAQREIAACNANGIHVIFRESDYYPPLLKKIFNPPDFIYVKGDLDVLKTKMLAVVGSRKASRYGGNALHSLLPPLCRAGLTIVSGMAYGIDSISHRVAVQQEGKTVGINAGGLLHLYPSGHHSLFPQIIDHGCIISEFPIDVVPRPYHFPIRNRIIAGISAAVLVVEAAIRSGSLITARLALDQNRDVLAVPGPIDSPLSRGTNHLIQQGAKLVAGADDILEEYNLPTSSDELDLRRGLNQKEIKLLDLIGVNEVKDIDYFVEQTGMSVSEVISVLMGLILKNLLMESEGGYRRIT